MIGELWGAQGNGATKLLPIPEQLKEHLIPADQRHAAREAIFANLTRLFAHSIRTGEQPALASAMGWKHRKCWMPSKNQLKQELDARYLVRSSSVISHTTTKGRVVESAGTELKEAFRPGPLE